jgi:hypothetical protein
VQVVRTHALKPGKETSQLYMTNVTVFKLFELTLEVIRDEDTICILSSREEAVTLHNSTTQAYVTSHFETQIMSHALTVQFPISL